MTAPVFPSATSSKTALACVGAWIVAAACTPWIGIWLAIGATAIGLGVTIAVFDRHGTRRLLVPSARRIVIGAIAGIAMAAATYLVYPWLTGVVPFIATDTARLYSAFRAPSLTVAAIALLPIILGEELVWRGAVQTVLVRRLGAWPGVLVAAIVYGAVFAPLGSPVLVTAALLCGLAWGILRAATGSLVPALVAHLTWDLLVLLWLPVG